METVAAYPGKPAVSDDDQVLSYSELDRRSSTLAARLGRLGVTAEDRVAICLPRSVDTFVAILGVLKAGAAYVAVDLRYPEARRDLMIRRSGAKLILVKPGGRRSLEHFGEAVLEWESGGASEDVPAAGRVVPPEAAACILFTSGSSGEPKAIVLEHRNLVAFARNQGLPTLLPTDRTAQISNVSFDAFSFETWCSFAYGAEIVVVPSITELLNSDLQRELRRRRISVMLAPTMALNHIVRMDRNAFSPLRILHTGGDVLLPSTCRDLLAGEFSGEFVNLYGPSEATTACTAYRVEHVGPDEDTVPIGRALDGVTTYVLDAVGRPVPQGEMGELHVAGPGVGRGYLDQPELTDERFPPDPFAGDGGRMYATGDLVRERADGLLEFVGRADDQVKVRGYRVEPGEVERVIGRHPQVRDVVVLPAGDGDGVRLVAFVVVDDALPPKDLRESLAGVLPDYMVPSAILPLQEIPSNDHGKRDRQALEQHLRDHQSRWRSYVPPADGTERYLTDLWERLLSVEHIGANDDFFEIGGNSLLAFRVRRTLQQDMGVSIGFRDILDNTVLRDLAKLIDEAAADLERKG
ncbi:non-ribosomal peptide synthetase [Nonomuraea diastatica]|uniref:Amino acid adenylation domain-containing protein n=1 Tax=Nonomuraea diastatica TaxID=1848329 RepID=A0A4R4WS58_9ACTN|nr:non-ribosomal peptide synthetase [Nonomuraea diastatica]TDD20290.1 amino acid adenylation domain-containing protein [Nonomuraea diastatica]